MITELKSKPGGWTVEKMTFPKGYSPSSVRWREKDGLYQVEVDRLLRENDTIDTFPQVEEPVIKERRGKRYITGWLTMDKKNYDFDREVAERV